MSTSKKKGAQQPAQVVTGGVGHGEVDPIALALRPPADETPQQRAARIRDEAEAKKVSDSIDAQLAVDSAEREKARKRGDIKILLLGQSESGKSTTVKNFQIAYAPNAWKQERKTWRAVIYLNLVRSVRRILALLDESHVAAGGRSLRFNTTEALDEGAGVLGDDDAANVPTNLGGHAAGAAKDDGDNNKRIPPKQDFSDFGPASTSSVMLSASGPLPSHLIELSLRLSPLGPVEEALIAALSSDDPSADDYEAVQLGSKDLLKGKANGRETALSAMHWRRTLRQKLSAAKLRKSSGESSSNGTNKTRRTSQSTSSSASHGGANDEQTVGDALDATVEYDILGTLRACSTDIIRLWKDPYVRDILKKRRFRPQDSSGFFLDDVERLMGSDYTPSDVDVLNARLKTVGVIEHSFTFDRGSERGVNWTIYDVGGARNQRHVWASFFDNVDAIIFLAPISAFNQVLSEDPRVNRVADSLHLFRAICANKLLSSVNIVLFLNKTDILRAKLEAGIELKKYILSYGDRRNDLESAEKFFRETFGSVFKEFATPGRDLYVHHTTMNDPKSAIAIINNVRDMLLRKSLMSSNLL